MPILVNDLVEQCRVQLDENVTADVSDTKILQVLNRAQQKLVRLASRHYPAMFRQETTVTSSTSSREIDLPVQAFGLLVNEVDCIKSGIAYKVHVADLRQLTAYDSDSSTADIPIYYAQQGKKLKIYPKMRNQTTLRVRYQVRPPTLVKSQGRITSIGTNQVFLDDLGTDLTTSVLQLKAFVNWIDSNTGLVRATLQVSAIDTAQKLVTFKTSGLDRTTVFGQTVSTSLPTDGVQDDFLAISNGTCIPMLVQDYADYLLQFSVVELKRKNGESIQDELPALKDLEDDIKLMWAGREPSMRVERANPYWGAKIPLIQRYR